MQRPWIDEKARRKQRAVHVHVVAMEHVRRVRVHREDRGPLVPLRPRSLSPVEIFEPLVGRGVVDARPRTCRVLVLTLERC